MLLPALAQARAKARGASCLSNMKQLTLAIFMYADDNNGNGLQSGSANRTDITGATANWDGCGGQRCGFATYYRADVYKPSLRMNFAEMTFTYTNDRSVYYCPTFNDVKQWPSIPYWIATVRSSGNPTTSWISAGTSSLYPPANTAIILDAVNTQTLSVIQAGCGSTAVTGTPPHSNTGNAAFADGHATTLPWQQALTVNGNTYIWLW